MQTITSRDVQSHFGDFLDQMQTSMVRVTRHGRPLFWAISDRDVRGDPTVLMGRILLLNGQANAYQGEHAGDDFGRLLSSFDSARTSADLTEGDVLQIVHDNRL